MSTPKDAMNYAARRQDMPGYAAIASDDPEDRDFVAKSVAQWIRAGMTVERVPCDEASHGHCLYIAEISRREDEAIKAAQAQQGLF
jgi:hypothetical protein